MRRFILACGLVLAAAFSAPLGAETRPLSGDEIREKVAGKRVFLRIPGGLGEFPLYYQASGRVDGSGEAAGLGRFMRPTDSGEWWVAGDRLCQRWTTWYDGRQFCFRISEAGESRISWTRDDGFSGTARIGR